jgi:hypothetical protein
MNRFTVMLVIGLALVASPVVPRSLAQTQAPPVSSPRNRALVLLDQADENARQALTAAIAPVEQRFAQAQQNTPALAANVLGWSGHWRLVADQIPYAGAGRHDAFLRDEIRRLLISGDPLEAAVRQAVAGYLQDERDNEDRLLVRLRQDLPDLPAPEIGPALDVRAVQAQLDATLAETTRQAVAALHQALVRELVVLVTSECLTRQAARLVVPASLEASGVMTFGLGLAAGVAVDQVLAWTWDQWSDPVGRLSQTLRQHLNDLRRQVLEGTAAAPGLRRRLESVARTRALRRRELILHQIETMGGAP